MKPSEDCVVVVSGGAVSVFSVLCLDLVWSLRDVCS